MFESKCMNCDEITFRDKEGNQQKFYRVWFMTSGGLAWLTSRKSYKPGEPVTVEPYSMSTSDTKTNFKLGLRIRD